MDGVPVTGTPVGSRTVIWANQNCSDLHHNSKFLTIRQKILHLLGYHIYSRNI